MKYKAKISFAGELSMYEGEVRELKESLASKFVDCGFLEKFNIEENEKNTSESKDEPSKDDEL